MNPLDEIEEIRRLNNKLWMSVLRIALQSSPVETKSVLRGIRENDMKISVLTGKLANGD